MKSRGIRQVPPRDLCRKKLHRLTEKNTEICVLPNGTVSRRCIECRDKRRAIYLRKRHKAYPSETGYCVKGLHKWVEENWSFDKSGAVRCRLCRNKAQMDRYFKKRVLRVVGPPHYVPCVGSGCRGGSMSTHENYICPWHRKNPPSWIATLGLVIRGTQVRRV